MWFWLAACALDGGVVRMTGVVHDAPDAQGNLVGDVDLTVVDASLAEIDSTTTGSDGTFDVGVPAGQPFFLSLTGEDYVPTHFSGTAGMADFSAGDGYPWIVTPAWEDDVRADFSACPAVGDGGGVVAGDVRLYIAGMDALQSLPAVDTARVTIYPESSDTALPACYHDDDGVSVADATDSGRDGRFAVFGVPPGGIAVEIVFVDTDGMSPSILYSFVVADGGFVPLYPALVYEGEL